MLNLITDDPWARIRALTLKTRDKRYVAVPYLGRGAADLLPLTDGDVLVTRFDRETVKSSQVDPAAVIEYLERGVRVYARENLHAKVFVLGARAVVGSTNASYNSANDLEEAALETTDRVVVDQCRRFVRSLCRDEVTSKYAKKLLPLYQPKGGRGGPKDSPSVQSSALTLIKTTDLKKALKGADKRAHERGLEEAKANLADASRFEVEEIRFIGEVPASIRTGARVMEVQPKDGGFILWPPARVLGVDRYRYENGKPRVMIFVEYRKRARARRLSVIQKNLPAAADLHKLIGRARLIPNALADQLTQLWVPL